jgi:tetratricopeptide (TPR) repeat protein
VRLEERGKTQEAMTHYEAILALDSAHAPSCINLGTIQYNQRRFIDAEGLYRRATEADPKYALAFFDLGNVLDELQRLPEAIEAYSTAIRLVPHYGDAHYNVALAYERVGDRRSALRHWTTYIKLDPIGPWSNHARIQVRKILEREKLSIVHRGSCVLHDHHLRRARPVPRLLAVPKPMLPM